MALALNEDQKRCPRCEVVKLRADFGKASRRRDGIQAYCKPCSVITARASRVKHLDKRLAAEREYASTNRDRYRAHSRRFRAENADYFKAWEAARPGDAVKRTLRWQAKNMDRVLAANSAYRAAQAAQAIPLTAEQKAQITATYAEAARLTRETGVPHHVDHEVPLRGKTVCGLHVPWNLRPMPAAANISKGNRLMLEAA